MSKDFDITDLNIHTIEVGYGTTSVVVSRGDTPIVRTFPSVPVPVRGPSELGGGVLQRSHCVDVVVDGTTYQVGEDAQAAQDPRIGRILNTEGFITSPRYKALLLAGLKMLPCSHVHVLALGLPVSVMGRKQELIKLAMGTHDVGGRSVTVERVMVFEQPLGALLHHVRLGGEQRKNSIKAQNTLTVDTGYLTVDWLLTNGYKPVGTRSGDTEQGMSKILHAVAPMLADQLRKSPAFANLREVNVELIDQAFVSGKLRLFGRSMPFPVSDGKDGSPVFDVTPAINAVTSEAVSAIVNSVGDGQDIDEIVLAGGPSALYMPALQKAYPAHAITVVDDQLRAVALGLQYTAEQYTMGIIKRGERFNAPVSA